MSRRPESRAPALRRWGQNFLRNARAAQQIIRALDARPDDLVLEIGPGRGALTGLLLQTGASVTAIEIDPRLVALLRKQHPDVAFRVVEGDATTVPLPDSSFLAVGNLPYNVATPIIRRVLQHPDCVRAVFMVQKEVARRFVASPGDDDYGFLTIVTRIRAVPSIVMNLGPGSFHPRPKVDSSVVLFETKPVDLSVDTDTFISVVSASFRMRRKKLVNNLVQARPDLSKSRLESILRSVDIDPSVRAETLTIEQFDRIALALSTASP